VGSSGPPPKSPPPILTRLPLLGASSFSPDQEKVRNCSCYFRKIHSTSGLGPFFTCGSEVSADEACGNCLLSLSLTMCFGFLTCWPLGYGLYRARDAYAGLRREITLQSFA